MRCLRVLCVALFLTLVHSTIKLTFAEIPAHEHAFPAFNHRLVTLDGVCSLTLFFVSSVGAKQLLFHLSAVALRRHTLFTSATEAFVARSRTSVLSTWHHLVADFTAAPARVIICVRASFRHFMLTAETDLRWSHVRAGRTRPSMASELTRMWAFSRPFPAATLATRMGWNTGQWFRVIFFPAPT
jgi:microcystin-dependent protein